jgi:hypothetical protein
MSSLSVEAAKNSCVPQEQNELVVQTGLTFQIPKLKFESLIGNMIYFIGDTNKTRYLPHKLQQLFQKYFHENHINEKASSFHPIGTILDIPQEYRSKSIIICFDEPSYNGRQCLYHLFGGDIKELSQSKGKPYQAFSELIDRTQNENTCGIVFVPKALQSDTLKPVMWCPKTVEEPKKDVKPPKFPKADVDEIYFNIPVEGYVSSRPRVAGQHVNELPKSIRSWVKTHYPETGYVMFGPDSTLYGLKDYLFSPRLADFQWQTTFQILPDEPKFPKSVPTTQDPVQAQLLALTEAITNLTKVIQEKMV